MALVELLTEQKNQTASPSETAKPGVGIPGKRIPELDGLRGIAILLVISFHYLNNQLLHASSSIGRAICQMTSFGWAGVDLFFVLSGFLIGSILVRNKHSNNFFSTFYIRRVVRIIPNYYLLMGVFFIVMLLPFFAGSGYLHKTNNIPWWSYMLLVQNFYMAAFHSLGNDAINVTWSICIEEQFYLVFPLIVFLLPKMWLPYILGLAIIMASVIRSHYDHWIPRYVLLPCRMDSIAFGALIAYFNEEYPFAQIMKRFKGIFGMVMALDILVCLFLFYKYKDLGVNKHFFLAIIFSGSLIAALAYKNTLYGAILRNKILNWIGSVSYSLYLFHYIILALLEYAILHYEGGVMLSGPRDFGVSVLALGFSFFFAWFVFRKLETPFVNFGKRFKY